jgi:hypothetical protein
MRSHTAIATTEARTRLRLVPRSDADEPEPARPEPRGRPSLETRVYELRNGGEALPVIAAVLTFEGYRTELGGEITPLEVWRILGRRLLASGHSDRSRERAP